MASSDNLTAIEPWMMFRSPITTSTTDSWPYSDAFSRETETALTKALQQSFFNQHQQQQHPVSPSFTVKQQSDNYYYRSASASTVTVSGSGSEPETPGSKRRGGVNNSLLGVKTANKRKSRASKRAMTTFIQADPSNFRQMVQQVTGVKLEGSGQLPVSSAVMKPEALRQPFINKLQGLLPTLDTSRYLLDHQRQNNKLQGVSGVGFSRAPAMGGGGGGGGGIDFDTFSSFPTLESWN